MFPCHSYFSLKHMRAVETERLERNEKRIGNAKNKNERVVSIINRCDKWLDTFPGTLFNCILHFSHCVELLCSVSFTTSSIEFSPRYNSSVFSTRKSDYNHSSNTRKETIPLSSEMKEGKYDEKQKAKTEKWVGRILLCEKTFHSS